MKALIAVVILACSAGSAFALGYPVSGRWGESPDTKPGAIDCNGKRVVKFEGERRFDSAGGVPQFRIRSLAAQGASSFRIIEEFDTAQIRARLTYVLRLRDADHIELVMSPGGTLKLQRCR